MNCHSKTKNYFYTVYQFTLTCIVTLSTILLSTNAAAQPNFANTTAKILPLGDSITHGGGIGKMPSYRRALWFKFQDAGFSVDFVGSDDSFFGDSVSLALQDFDLDHEGHWAWTADEVDAALGNWLLGYTPDIALIHLGTNDFDYGHTNASTMLELTSIINKLRTDNPNILILLAQIIPMRNEDTASINTEIAILAGNLTTTQSPVVLVDQYTGYDPFVDSYDKWHPNELGEEKMAQKWFDALAPFFVEEEVSTPIPFWASIGSLLSFSLIYSLRKKAPKLSIK